MDLSDEQLIADFQCGSGPASERELFDEIYSRYHSRVISWCCRFTHDRELSNDLAQEIFFKAFRRFHTFRSDSKLSTWLYSITRNHCIDAVNRRSSELVEPVDLGTVRMADPSAVNAERHLGRIQEQDLLLRVIYKNLNPTEARVMTLHYGHEVPISDVTAMLELTNTSGAKAYIVSARRKISAAARGLKFAS